MIRHEGPKGAWMRDHPTSALAGMGMDKTVALSRREIWAQGSPSAMFPRPPRGPIALVREGDMISADIPAKKLDILVDEV